MTESKTYNQMIQSALKSSMKEDSKVLLMGLGISDPKRFFGTTLDLLEEFSEERVIECPTSENGYLGHSIGLALGGFKPIVHFQRMDFMLYAFDQLVNNLAKWKYMFGQKQNPSVVIRALIGIGWGQGAQHSQNLAPLLAQIPGLEVVCPTCPASASILLKKSLQRNSSVIFVEHRWLQFLKQDPTKAAKDFEIGKALVRRSGKQATVVTWSYSTVEALRFQELFPELDLEVIDLLSLQPLDIGTVLASVEKTGRLILWEPSIQFAGIGAEIIAQLHQRNLSFTLLRSGYPLASPGSSPRLSQQYYPQLEKLTSEISRFLSLPLKYSASLRWPKDQDLSDWSPWV